MRGLLFACVFSTLTIHASGQPTPPAPAVAMQANAGSVATLVPEGAIQVVGAKTVRFCECDSRAADFAVRIVAPNTVTLGENEQPRLLEVLLNSVRIPTDRFTVEWRHDKRVPKALALRAASSLREPGTYSVVVEPLPVTRPDEPVETFQIVVPAAKIDVPAMLVVERRVRWPWGATPIVDERKTPLIVRETGRVTGIENLAGASMPMTAGATVTTARVSMKAGTVPRDEWATLSYDVQGDFPLGTTTGSLIVGAPELEAPRLIPVEVRSRLEWFFLLVTILAGFVVSWLLKVRLAGHIELTQARALAQKLLASIEADRVRFAEDDFTQALAKDMATLASLIKLRDAGEIERVRTKLDAIWRDAVKAAETRRAELAAKARSFSNLVSLDWKLPLFLRPRLDRARADARRLVTTPFAPNVLTSETQLKGVQTDFLSALKSDAGAWLQASQAAFLEIVRREDGIPQPLAEAITAQLAAFEERFPSPDPLPTEFDIANLESTIRAVAGQYMALRGVERALTREWDRTREALRKGLADRKALADVEEYTRQAQHDLSILVDEPLHEAALQQTLSNLQSAWERASPTVAQAAAQFERSQGVPGLDFVTSLLPITSRGLSVAVVGGPAAPFFAMFLSSGRALRRAKALQSVVLGAVTMLSVFTAQNAVWDGSWRGLMTVFIAAIAIDVTADTMLARLRGTPAH